MALKLYTETLFPSTTESPLHHLWTKVNTPLTLRTSASPPIRNHETLRLTLSSNEYEDANPVGHLQNCLRACFKAHRRTTKLMLKHARIKEDSHTAKLSFACSLQNLKRIFNASSARRRSNRTPKPSPQTSQLSRMRTRGDSSLARRKS